MGLLAGQAEQPYYDGSGVPFGSYQFTNLNNIIVNFMATYVGEGKVLAKTNRGDVFFHGHRALQELSFDTFKSCKAQEITVPPSLQMILPQDYVNYTKVSVIDEGGIKHLLYPASKTSNPSNPIQNSDGDFALQAIGTLNSTTTVVLDDEYSNVLVGMVVVAPNVPTLTTVIDIVTAANITTITLSAAATYTGTETLTFHTSTQDLVSQEESSIISIGATWAAADDKITLASIADANSIEIGMLVSDIAFVAGTTVVDVNGVIVTVSGNSSVAGVATSLTFISPNSTSDTWVNYKSGGSSENQDDTYWPMQGSRFGLDPQYAQANGSFYIDCISGKIHFSSNVAGKTVVLDYISDSLGTGAEQGAPGVDLIVHKFAEEAVYKWILYGCVSARIDIPEHVVLRYKKEKFAETRKAKLRLSNLKLEELTQILRGKSKQIKH